MATNKANPPNGKIVVVFGASRGLGKAVALKLAHEGYVVGVAAKSTEDTQAGVKAKYKLEGTIEAVVREIEAFGGLGLALPWDAITSTPASISGLLSAITTKFPSPRFYFHSIIYNAGALSWRSIQATDLKKFDLLWGVNARGSFIVVKEALEWLRKAEVQRGEGIDWTPKIVVVSPPIYSRFFRGKVPYAMSKIPMTALITALPIDIARAHPTSRITPVSFWPATSIQSAATAALETSTSSRAGMYLRKPEIWSDSLHVLLEDNGKKELEGRALVDEDYLRERGGYTDKDFEKYRLDPAVEPKRAVPKQFPSLRVEEEDEETIDTRELEAMSKVFGQAGAIKPKL